MSSLDMFPDSFIDYLVTNKDKRVPSMFAKYSDVKPGDVLIADGGFTCIRHGEVKTVLIGDNGSMYISCDHGRHTLEGQVNEQGILTGLTLSA